MLVFRAGIHKMLVRIANREDPDLSDLGLHCLSRLYSSIKIFYSTAKSILYDQTSEYFEHKI